MAYSADRGRGAHMSSYQQAVAKRCVATTRIHGPVWAVRVTLTKHTPGVQSGRQAARRARTRLLAQSRPSESRVTRRNADAACRGVLPRGAFITFTYVVKPEAFKPGSRLPKVNRVIKGQHMGEFEELILLAVRQLGEHAHSSGIQTLLARRANREVTLGAIYSALDRCQRKGLAESWLSESSGARGGRPKRHYRVTPEGEASLLESRRIREGLWQDPALEQA